MKCKKIQRLIITDYIDKEINNELENEINSHLKICNKCKKLEYTLKKIAIMPFREQNRVYPQEKTWDRIKEAIEKQQEQKKYSFIDIIDNLNLILHSPKPAVVVATLTLFIFIISAFMSLSFSNRRIVNIYLNEQMEFLTYLKSEEQTDLFQNYKLNLGESSEKYFL